MGVKLKPGDAVLYVPDGCHARDHELFEATRQQGAFGAPGGTAPARRAAVPSGTPFPPAWEGTVRAETQPHHGQPSEPVPVDADGFVVPDAEGRVAIDVPHPSGHYVLHYVVRHDAGKAPHTFHLPGE